MTDFLERLPWRLASLAGLVVGAASLIGGADPWVSLLRVGGAFLVFGGLGMALRALMRGGRPAPPQEGKPAPPAPDDGGAGSHVDQKTPEMTVDDL